MNPPTSLDKVLAKHRERLGDPVTMEELFKLHDAVLGSGSLSEEERIQLLDRVAADPDAAHKLKALMRFPEISAGEEAEGVDERWADFKVQLPPSDAVPEEDGPGWISQFWVPDGRRRYGLLAAILVFCSVLMLWLGRTLAPGPLVESGIARVQVNTPIVELTAPGIEHRGTKRIPLPAKAQALVIVLSAPEIHTRKPLDLVVVNAKGDLISRSSGILPDEAGIFSATFSRELLGPGVYELQLQNEQREVSAAFPIEVYSIR